MQESDQLAKREQRRLELTEMWQNRRGQQTVLGLFHGALPGGEVARAGMSVIDVILESEFGGPEGEAQSENN